MQILFTIGINRKGNSDKHGLHIYQSAEIF
jgi:hypothetical protein